MSDKRFLAVEKYLNKKKEKVIIDLIIKDYDKSNFYIALVFNKKIEKFKVLFVPIDVLEINRVEEYCCYQFINLVTVNYFLETFNNVKDVCRDKSFTNKLSKTMKAYYVEINAHIGGEDFKFLTNQIIPQEWDFLFDIIVSLFEHLPNVVSELCNKLLGLFNDVFGHVKYDYSLDIDLTKDNLGLFNEEEIKLGEEKLKDVTFSEKKYGNYVVILDDKLFVFAIDKYKGIFNVYMEDVNLGKEYLYALYLVYKKEFINKYVKLVYDGNSSLIYRLEDDKFLVINDFKKEQYSFQDVFSKSFEILDATREFKKKLVGALEKNYEKDIAEIVHNVKMIES